MNRIFISPNYGDESVQPGDILAFSRTIDYEEEEDSDVDYTEDETVLEYDFDEDEDEDEYEEPTREDNRTASVFMRVVSVTPPVKKLFHKESGHIIVELPNKKQVELYNFTGHKYGVPTLSAEMENYIRSVRGLCTRLSLEARIENKKAEQPDFFGLELFDVNEDPASFIKALEEELEQRRIVATEKNQAEQATNQIEQVKKFFYRHP